MPVRLLICAAVFATLALGIALCDSAVPAPHRLTAPMTTCEHLRQSAWWPTKPHAPEDAGQYIGSAACARCHAGIAAAQRTSQMARTLTSAAASTVAHQHLSSQYRAGSYTWSLRESGTELAVHVTDGDATRSAALQWAFGSGDVGQSYLWQAGDSFRETRFNFFSALNGLGATPGRLHGAPTSIDMALARPVEAFEARTCFACHTTTMSSATPLDTASLVPGVGCEACHGPGAAHVHAIEANRSSSAGATQTPSRITADTIGETTSPTAIPPASSDAVWDRAILNPARLSPAASVDLCGSCHSTAWDVRLMGAAGVQTVRFPAYRLEQSRCWLQSSPELALRSSTEAGMPVDAPGGSRRHSSSPVSAAPSNPTDSSQATFGDARLTCFACHDPHAPIAREPAAYDSACLDCHTTRGGSPSRPVTVAQRSGSNATPTPSDSTHPGAACPVATSRCVTCHMPKLELPELHYGFTDHRIRVARAGAPFPD